MTRGDTVIRKCSACGSYVAEHTIRSGNTLGARLWTDGKREAPMLPEQMWLAKCAHCAALIWIDELEVVGKIEPWEPWQPPKPAFGEAAKFKDARPIAEPTMQDFLSLLAKGVGDKKKEQYLRLRAWWLGNDERRKSGVPIPLTVEEIGNLRAFAQLLDPADEHDRIMKGEILRELGAFAVAETLLAKPFAEPLEQAAAIIRALCKQSVAAVQEMRFK